MMVIQQRLESQMACSLLPVWLICFPQVTTSCTQAHDYMGSFDELQHQDCMLVWHTLKWHGPRQQQMKVTWLLLAAN